MKYNPSSDDIIVREGETLFYLKFLPWDTAFFGKNSYILDVEKSILVPSVGMKKLIEREIGTSFITIKIDSNCNKELLEFLQALGFRYIETEVTLKLDKTQRIELTKPAGIEVIRLEKKSSLPYKELGSVFSLTRFHSDVHIPKEKADLLWIEYISNYEITPSNLMFVAKQGEKVAGCILVNEIRNQERAFLSFVSVLEEFRGKAIGSYLIRHIVEKLCECELATGTQVRNIRALNFYIKNGFSIIEQTKTVLHRWSS